jgi:hypothetical protein
VLTSTAVAVPPKPTSLLSKPPQVELVLLLNIMSSVRGAVRAELLDATTAQPLAGYSLNESVPLVGHNALQAPLQWSTLRSDPSSSELEDGSQLKLRLESTYTKIFSFQLAWRPVPPPPPPGPTVSRDPVPNQWHACYAH